MTSSPHALPGRLPEHPAGGRSPISAALPESAARPGYFAPQNASDLETVIETLASAGGPLTFVVGAGASMEAGLPSWATLVRRIVEEVAPGLPRDERAAWLDAIHDNGLLTAAAIARARSPDEKRFRKMLWQALYGNGSPSDFQPGPLTQELAGFATTFPEITQLVTFNYDDLLERALQTLGVSTEGRADDSSEVPGVRAIRHLHGRLYDPKLRDPVILTEADYARFPAGEAWQDQTMRRALDGLCVFVGLSFSDPNLLRWVYTSKGQRHLALFTRQSSPSLQPEVRRAFEHATRARLQAAGVAAYWTDFYGELAQVIREARRRRGPGRPPHPFLTRATRVAERGRRRCIPQDRRFAGRQREVNAVLIALLEIVRSAAAAAGVDLAGEHLGLALWGVDHQQREISLWASSDSLHASPRSITPIPLDYASSWVAVEAVTRCNAIERDPEVYASRWRFVRGIPLIHDGENDRIAVGAATLTSTTPGSGLTVLREPAKREIDSKLHERLIRLWR